MTVQSTTARADYNGNNVTTLFTVPFYFLDNSHVKAVRTDNSTSPPTTATLVLGTDYVLTGAGVQIGGSIQTTVAPTASQVLTILRSVPFTQLIHYVPNDPFPAATHEQALDQLTMEVQELNEISSHALQFPSYEPVPAVLPAAATRAGMLLGFDQLGARSLYPVTATVGAGDLRVERWADGVDYTSGTSTTVTLSRTYITKANLGTVVMQGIAQDPNSYTLSGTSLIFNAAIPAGIAEIWCFGGTTLSQGVPTAGSVTDVAVATGANINSAKIAYQRAAAGAVLRTLFSKLGDRFDVADFGIVGDGATDNAIAINSALTAMGPGVLVFGAGTFLTSGPHALGAGQYIAGAGPFATVISDSSLVNDTFTMATLYSGVKDLSITGNPARTGGRSLATTANQGGPNLISNIYLSNYFVGIEINSNRLYVDRVTAINACSPSSQIISIKGGGDIFIDTISADSGIQPAYGIVATAGAGVWISNCDLIHCLNGVALTPSGTTQMGNFWFTNVTADSCGNNAWTLQTAGTATIFAVEFKGCWGASSVNTGFLINGAGGAVDGLFFSDHNATNNGLDGLAFVGNVKNITMVGGIVTGNSQTTPGAANGINIGANISGVNIGFMRVGPSQVFADTQGNQILVNAGSGSNINIANCDLSTARTPVTFSATGTNNSLSNCGGVVTKGQAIATSDGSGHIAVAHTLGGVPKEVFVSVLNAGTPIFAQPDSFTSSGFRVTFWNSAGALLTGTALVFSWRVEL